LLVCLFVLEGLALLVCLFVYKSWSAFLKPQHIQSLLNCPHHRLRPRYRINYTLRTTAMKSTSSLITLGLASLATAQFTISNTTGAISCAIPNGTYCAGDSNIIIRCINGVGQAGNCNDNLAGEPPLGVNYAPCFDCGANSGRAACSKNGIVYPGSGTGLGNTSFPTNSTSACAATSPTGAPYSNGTNPGGPIINATYTSTATNTPVATNTPIATYTPAASPTGGYGSPSSSSGAPVPYTGAATSVQMMGAGAVVGFGTLFAALGIM